MAYIKGYEYDIFISYCHIDNEESNKRNTGWVERFYNELTVLLRRSIGTRDISIWWDSKRLDGSIVFDDAIAEAIKRSAIFICLNSPSFLRSEYCQKELRSFYRHAEQDPHGLKLKNHYRILNLLLFNIPYAEWPKELSGTTGFSFHDAQEEEEQGYTLAVKSGKFKTQLHKLKDAVIALINEFGQAPAKAPQDPGFAIYFSDVSDSLSTQRERTITELQKKGYKVHYDIPPPYEPAEHEQAVKAKLEQAHLSVHLLDQFKGRKIAGQELIWYPQKQLELSLEIDKPKLIWIPEEIKISEVEEEQYKNFLLTLETGETFSEKTSYIRGKKSRLLQEILDLAEVLKKRQDQTAPESLSVLLDAHYVDQYSAYDLCKNLVEEQIHPFLNPQEIDPRTNMQFLEDRIRSVKKLVFFYGKVSGQWIEERFIAAKQYILDSEYPIKDFLLFLMPPVKNPDEISLQFGVPKIDVIDNSASSQLQISALKQLLERIKATS